MGGYQPTDRDDILDLIMRYAVAVDTRDFDGVAACFTEDATAEYSGHVLDPGVKPIIDHISGIASFPASQHVFGSSTVDINGDSAHTVSYAVAYLVGPVDGGHEVISRGLVYTDDLIRTSDGWRIKNRVHKPIWSTTGPCDYPVGPSR
jgi:ketosteroid isomerase-like protein